ncbi:hypothetical protein TNCV_2959381 [Trichonephila clavipes]|nr:hypothetical protein TNCV_2959381 [Trichonephila clavipes]
MINIAITFRPVLITKKPRFGIVQLNKYQTFVRETNIVIIKFNLGRNVVSSDMVMRIKVSKVIAAESSGIGNGTSLLMARLKILDEVLTSTTRTTPSLPGKTSRMGSLKKRADSPSNLDSGHST